MAELEDNLQAVVKINEQQDISTYLSKSQTKWYPVFNNDAVKQGELMVYTQFIPDPSW